MNKIKISVVITVMIMFCFILTGCNSSTADESFFVGKWAGKAYYGDGENVTFEVIEGFDYDFDQFIRLEINNDNTFTDVRKNGEKAFNGTWNFEGGQIILSYEESGEEYFIEKKDDLTIKLTWNDDDKYILLEKDKNDVLEEVDFKDIEDPNIISVSAGYDYTVGLKSDGTVVAVGRNKYGQCDVSEWIDIAAISTGSYHTVGLKSDGAVVAVGDNRFGQCDVSNWK